MAVLSEPILPARARGSKLLERGYFALVLLALLTYGANSTLAFVLCFWLAASLCLGALLTFGRPEKTRIPFVLCIGLFLGLAIWTGLQLVPVPAGMAAPIWQELPKFGIEGPRNSISVAPGETLVGWLRLALPFLTFLAGLLIFRTDDQAVNAFRFLAVAGGLLATLCLIQFVVMPGVLLFSEKRHDLDTYAFVFVNRNTAATALGLLGLMLGAGVQQEWRRLDRTKIVAWMMNGVPLARSVRLRPFVLHSSLLLVVLLCLALTKSRGGIAATAIAATVMLTLLSWHGGRSGPSGFSRQRRSLLTKVGQVMLYGLLVLAAVGLSAPRALLRGEIEGIADGRACILEGLLSAAHDNWLTGGGFGAFPFVFNAYRDPSCGVGAVWDKAHNVFLEGFIGFGILFVPVLLLGLWSLLRAYGTGLGERRNLMVYPIAGMAGLCLVTLHGLADFSLQIPGLAVFYSMFAALTVTISLGRRKSSASRAEADMPRPATHRYFSVWDLAFTGIVVVSMLAAASAAKDALAVVSVRAYARALDAGDPVDMGALDLLAAEGLPANRLATCNGEVLRSTLTVLLAHLDRADRESAYEVWAQRLGSAEKQVGHALSCLPADGNLWLRLAMLRQAGGEVPGEQAALMALAQQLAPSERRQLVGRLAQWNRLSSATLVLARDEVIADVRNGLNFLDVPDIRTALRVPSTAILGIIRETLPLVSGVRRKVLESGGFDWIERLRAGARSDRALDPARS